MRFTGLKPRTVRACILVLVQQNVLWHASEEDVEVFEVNTDECLARSRFGTYIHLMEELYGQAVRDHRFTYVICLNLHHRLHKF